MYKGGGGLTAQPCTEMCLVVEQRELHVLPLLPTVVQYGKNNRKGQDSSPHNSEIVAPVPGGTVSFRNLLFQKIIPDRAAEYSPLYDEYNVKCVRVN